MRQVPQWGTIPRMLRDQAVRRADALIVIDGPARLRVSQLGRQAAQGARALIAMGVQPGDRVAVIGPSGLRWVISAFAIWDAAAVVVPVPGRSRGPELRHVLEVSQASILIACDDPHGPSPLSLLAEACGEPAVGRPYAGLRRLRTVILVDEPRAAADAPQARRPGVLRLPSFLARGLSVAARVAEDRALAVQPNDPCEILFTPGPAEFPEPVMLHHAPLLRTYWDWSEAATLGEGDRYAVIAPLHTGSGLNGGMLACALAGAAMLPLTGFDSAALDPWALLDLIERRRVSILAGPPALFYLLLNCLPAVPRDLSSLRVAICDSTTVPPDLIRRLLTETRIQRVINAYGLIEARIS